VETLTTTPATRSPRQGSRAVLAGVIALVAAAGIAAGTLIARDDDTVGASDAASQVAAVRGACESWLDSDTTQPGTANWCTGMAEWMMRRVDRDGIGPEMMWGDPGRMGDACQQWMAASPRDGTEVDAERWCSSMVTWMGDHMGDWSGRVHWDDWMMHGMGRR
jgi:hypothetical protein